MGLGKFLKEKVFTKEFYNTYFSSGGTQQNYIKQRDTYENCENFPSLANYKKYEKIITKHFQLSDKIQVMYSIAINQENIFNEHTKKCEQLCLEDIALAPIYKEYLDNDSEEARTFYGMYVAFPTLAKIYEKKNDIDNAILICIQAIQLGFTIDHSKSGMQGRLARLIKKHNQSSNKKLQYDYEKNILFDDETGEPLFNDKE